MNVFGSLQGHNHSLLEISKASQFVSIKEMPLKAIIDGGNEQIFYIGQEGSLKGLYSYDGNFNPLDETNNQGPNGIAYQWICYDEYPKVNEDCSLIIDSPLNSPVLFFRSSETDLNHVFHFILMISDQVGRVAISETRVKIISLQSDEPFVRFVSTDISQFMNHRRYVVEFASSKPLEGQISWSLNNSLVDLSANSLTPSIQNISWKSNENQQLYYQQRFYFDLSLDNVVSLSSFFTKFKDLELTFSFHNAENHRMSSISTILLLNQAPQSGGLAIEPSNARSFLDIVTISAVQWTDEDLPLSYAFSYNLNDSALLSKDEALVAYYPLQLQSEQSYVFTLFPNILNGTFSDNEVEVHVLSIQVEVFDSLGQKNSIRELLQLSSSRSFAPSSTISRETFDFHEYYRSAEADEGSDHLGKTLLELATYSQLIYSPDLQYLSASLLLNELKTSKEEKINARKLLTVSSTSNTPSSSSAQQYLSAPLCPSLDENQEQLLTEQSYQLDMLLNISSRSFPSEYQLQQWMSLFGEILIQTDSFSALSHSDQWKAMELLTYYLSMSNKMGISFEDIFFSPEEDNNKSAANIWKVMDTIYESFLRSLSCQINGTNPFYEMISSSSSSSSNQQLLSSMMKPWFVPFSSLLEEMTLSAFNSFLPSMTSLPLLVKEDTFSAHYHAMDLSTATISTMNLKNPDHYELSLSVSNQNASTFKMAAYLNTWASLQEESIIFTTDAYAIKPSSSNRNQTKFMNYPLTIAIEDEEQACHTYPLRTGNFQPPASKHCNFTATIENNEEIIYHSSKNVSAASSIQCTFLQEETHIIPCVQYDSRGQLILNESLTLTCDGKFTGKIDYSCPYYESYPLCLLSVRNTSQPDALTSTSFNDVCSATSFNGQQTTCECSVRDIFNVVTGQEAILNENYLNELNSRKRQRRRHLLSSSLPSSDSIFAASSSSTNANPLLTSRGDVSVAMFDLLVYREEKYIDRVVNYVSKTTSTLRGQPIENSNEPISTSSLTAAAMMFQPMASLKSFLSSFF
jgi:hypothetical protein